uniref:Cytochrome c family protein n=1 Tax=Magnetococcus massalia (strain MO-1) TaxID=451514 RepID=A0A1S7LGM2_MAGMO|nr:Cytochrome c family protein [Candidatus Magnetococcus massalia]
MRMMEKSESMGDKPGKGKQVLKGLWLGVAVVVASSVLLLLWGKGGQSMGRADQSSMDEIPMVLAPPTVIPQAHQEGQQRFEKQCAQCHGPWAEGTQQGPPLVHPYYRPDHHADYAFYQALERGVRAHHWSFGDMPPPDPAITQDQADQLVAFIRWWQRENGIQ